MLVKSALRKTFLAARNSYTPKERKTLGNAICRRLASTREFKEARIILFYFPVRSEPDCLQAVKKAFALGKKVLFPRVEGEKLAAMEAKSFGEVLAFQPGTLGIPEPRGEKTPARQIDLAVLPGIAFDEHGRRLGYGGGFYDRFLKKLKKSAVRVGLCFEKTLASDLPEEKGDEKVDCIISERRVIRKA